MSRTISIYLPVAGSVARVPVIIVVVRRVGMEVRRGHCVTFSHLVDIYYPVFLPGAYSTAAKGVFVDDRL